MPVFVVFLLGLVAHVLISLLAPIFYAGKDTRTPVAAALLAVAVDVVAAAVLFPLFGLDGPGAGHRPRGVGGGFDAVLLHAAPAGLRSATARPDRGVRHSGSVAHGRRRALAADRFVSSLTHGSTSFPALVLELAVAGLAGAGVYLAWSRLLRLPELAIATDLVKTLLRRS